MRKKEKLKKIKILMKKNIETLFQTQKNKN